MYRVLNKLSGETYGDFETFEEAKTLENKHVNVIICDLSIPKEVRKKKVQELWDEIKINKSFDEKFNEWVKADQEYTALYDEDY